MSDVDDFAPSPRRGYRAVRSISSGGSTEATTFVDRRSLQTRRRRQPAISKHRDAHPGLLVPGGGLRRYVGDTFDGGSEWILRAATYGWVCLANGQRNVTQQMFAWIENAATPEAHLPEQVQDHVQSPYMLQYWQNKWGATATPLLWSHATHAILAHELNPLTCTVTGCPINPPASPRSVRA